VLCLLLAGGTDLRTTGNQPKKAKRALEQAEPFNGAPELEPRPQASGSGAPQEQSVPIQVHLGNVVYTVQGVVG
jgi:hypothetical protein